MKEVVKQIVEYVDKANQILIVGHENPDGDAVGSVLGLYHVLTKKGKRVIPIFPNDAPAFLKWLPNYNDALLFNKDRQNVEDAFDKSDLIFCLDFNERKRVGKMEYVLSTNKTTKVLIDHHPYPDAFFDVLISEQEISSTAELVYKVIENCGWASFLTKQAAECLFTGIMTDTISFTVNASRAKTFETAASLLSFEIDKELIHRRVFNSFTQQRMRMLGYSLHKKMKIIPEFATGYIYLNKDELKEFCFQKGDTEGFVNYPLSIKGIRFAALFLERDGYIKISFRSVGAIPVNEIMAKHFSGGGHKNAAGGEEINLSLDECIKKFEAILPLYKDTLLHEED
ncbi:MAG TPA: bifunctional oligoribonuclease/PAP phosphatase NrnA [Bacteroidales bacterium]|nr:bifunctional oligoribonuclease/PAP phosphatase NrnA [Bacteroidales bacterium]